MRNEAYYNNGMSTWGSRLAHLGVNAPRKVMVGVILMISLFAFEMFNFDTTQYALRNLLGEIKFLGLQWASILAIAFCSIDFAGLVRLFTPERGADEPREVWYLMGAWLLGATMNAIMTWWAVSLTLLNHNFGNEVLSREQLLRAVPIFVAVLVWLTRILFIGAFTVAGEHLFEASGAGVSSRPQMAQPGLARNAQPELPKMAQPASRMVSRQRPTPTMATPTPMTAVPTPMTAAPAPTPAMMSSQAVPDEPPFVDDFTPVSAPMTPPTARTTAVPQRENNSRVRQRPPRPNGPTGAVRRVPAGIQASPRNLR